MNREKWSTARFLVLLVGGLLSGGGILGVVTMTIGVEIRIAAFQTDAADTAVVIGFFTIVFMLATLVLMLNWTVTADPPHPPETDGVNAVPQIGAEFDRRVRQRLFPLKLPATEREEIRDRLYDAAIHTVARTTNSDRDTARDRIERGTWTDDTEAAAFLATTKPPRTVRLRQAISGHCWFARGARRTAQAIIRHADADNELEPDR